VTKSRVSLEKQLHEIERLRGEMSAKEPAQRRTVTRAVARILDDVHLEETPSGAEPLPLRHHFDRPPLEPGQVAPATTARFPPHRNW
jgi:hypothetical protein